MAKTFITGEEKNKHNPERIIDLGPLRYQIEKFRCSDVEHVLYKLSYAGKYIYIKGKSLAGSLIILVDTLNSFNPKSERFKGHLYTHLYAHLLDSVPGKVRINIITTAADEDSFYLLLKNEQLCLDEGRYDPKCLNNQIEAYIPKYNENTGMYGWIPKNAVMNFNRWLGSADRKSHTDQYKK